MKSPQVCSLSFRSRLSCNFASLLLVVIVAGFSSPLALAQNSVKAPPTPQQGPVGFQPFTPPVIQQRTAKLIGHYNPEQMLRVTIALQPPHWAEEQQFLKDLQNDAKASPKSQGFLTAEQWNARFAPTAEDEQAVVDWAKSQGLEVTHRYANRLVVDVAAPAGVLEHAFGVTLNIYQYQTKQENRTFFSNDADPQVPANLTHIVQAVIGLNSWERMHASSKNARPPVVTDYAAGPAKSQPAGTKGDGDASKIPNANGPKKNGGIPNITGGAYDPSDIYSSEAYDYNALYHQGHCCNPFGAPNSPPEASIAIASVGSQNFGDMVGFHNSYTYLAWNITEFGIDGQSVPCTDATDATCDQEGTMDMEWSTAMSNSFGSLHDTAQVFMYDVPNFGSLPDAYQHMLNDGFARVASTSWSCTAQDGCGSSFINSLDSIFSNMVGQGWTLVAAQGDRGATDDLDNDLDVAFPGSDGNVVSAGGTTLTLDQMTANYVSEVTWTGGSQGAARNDGGTGGGCSTAGVPAYQHDNATCSFSFLGITIYLRQVPDISLNADWLNTPQNLYFGGGLSGNGGTSIVAPELAGFFAQENAYLLSLGNICGSGSSPCAPMGNVNNFLYAEGYNGGAPHRPFYDITSGCNNNDITAFYGLSYYCAAAGYDLATGWGSANMLQLAWAINWYHVPGFSIPVVSFTGPATNTWYNSDQEISWTVSAPPANSFPSDGVAGFTQGWDSIPSDPSSEATPGSGNSYYTGPQYANATSGCLSLARGFGCAGGVSQGFHTAHVQAWDNQGKSSGNVSYGPIGYDTIPPITGHGQSPAANGSGWNKSAVNVTLSAFDPGAPLTGSGVFATYYSIDNGFCGPILLGSCVPYGGPFNVSVQGIHTVYFFSKDVAGNFELRNTATVRIDETAPVSAASLSGTLNGPVYVSPVKVTLSASDNLSGVASTAYQINGGAVQTYTAPFSVANLGSNTVTFHSTDKAGNVETSKTVSFTIKGATTTSVSSSKNPSVLGSPVTFTATVTSTVGTATGTVTFKNGATTLGTGSLVAGKATLTTSALTPGSHSITAVYGGGADFLASTSPVLTQTVLAVTSTSVIASANPSVFGQTVTFTATVTSVTAGTITGSVTFKDGISVLGSGVISGGKAKFSTSALAVGSHSITGVYSGNAAYATSTSSTLSHTVNKASSSTIVISSHNPSVFGQSVTFTATVAAVAPGSGTPTGTVTFKNGATVLGTGTLSSGKATFPTSALTVGAHSITAVYGGSANYNTSTSAVLTETVNKASSSTKLTSSLNPSTLGKSVTFTITVVTVAPGSGTPTGTVTLKNGATTVGTATLTSGKATIPTSALTHGAHSMTAVYSGSVDDLSSTSAILTQTVN
jgi:Bacterial Ig-like domain (group 3)/Pro-kumamolisin, activation domain